MTDDQRTPTRVHVALLGVQIAFASLAVEGKLAMSPRHGVSPHALALLRMLGASAVFVSAHAALGTPRVRALGDMARLLGLSLAGVVINQVLFLSGLRLTSPMAATLLVATIPIFAALVAAAFRRDKLTIRSVLGIAVAVFGIAVLSRFALPRAGDLLVLANALSYAFYLVFAKGMLERYGAVTVMAWVFGLGALMFSPIGAASLAAEAGGWSPAALALVGFVVLVPTVIGYGVSAWALRRASPTLVGVYVYLQPVFVALLAWLQLDEPLGMHTAAGGVLILVGVAVVAAGRATDRRHGAALADSP